MTDLSAVPVDVEQLPGDLSQSFIHPLRYKNIDRWGTNEGWFKAFRETSDPAVLHALLDVGIDLCAENPSNLTVPQMLDQHPSQGLARRLTTYFKLADGHSDVACIVGPRDTWSHDSGRDKVREVLAHHAYRVLVKRLFTQVTYEFDRGSVRPLLKHPDLVSAMLRFADAGYENIMLGAVPDERRKIEMFFNLLCILLWQERRWNEERPTMLRILNELYHLDALLDASVVVDKESMKTLERFALKGTVPPHSIETSAANGNDAAQILILLRVKHSEHRKAEAATVAKRREQNRMLRKAKLQTARADLRAARDRLAGLGNGKK